MSSGPSLSFRDERERARGFDTLSRVRVLAVLALLLCAGLLIKAVAERQSEPLGVFVQVNGEVPEPGLYALPGGGTVLDALVKAGMEHPPLSDVLSQALVDGARITVEDGQVLLGEAEARVILGLPVDLNTASSQTIQALPGIGPATAMAILQERERGCFQDLDSLTRVKGVGPKTLERLRPFIKASCDPGDPTEFTEAEAPTLEAPTVKRDLVMLPLDLNHATEAQLDALPGIGPAKAAAIAQDRSTRGPFNDVDELVRVSGIGEKTLEKLRPFVEVKEDR